MTKLTSSAALALALACLAACDSRTSAEFRAERANRQYQSAMSDYSAGRIAEAARGFEKVVKADPGNASARFQLACIQQDALHDYVGAFCGYREYLMLAPDSDKAKLAKDRLALCERLLADEFAKKVNVSGGEAVGAENERLKEEVRQLKVALEKADDAVAEGQRMYQKMREENERLKKLLATMGSGDDEPDAQQSIASVRDLLDDDEDGARPQPLGDAKSLADLADDGAGASSLLPQQTADAKERKKSEDAARKKAKSEKDAANKEIPETYVVQEGDTLYKIAVRFYGKTSAWKRIREANKDKISTDGRVRHGQVIQLPR
ncbi:MAG: LysM peptidoglycan-binding domain-containing protein [Kiritimatiellae bacterium]|nr:LysM peptidoglycan-binding domain-containing protein [Kiritimatiellia bacterium]